MCVCVCMCEIRYGDEIDARGDMKAMKGLERIIAEGGILLLAVPVGRDLVVWNAHRCYTLVVNTHALCMHTLFLFVCTLCTPTHFVCTQAVYAYLCGDVELCVCVCVRARVRVRACVRCDQGIRTSETNDVAHAMDCGKNLGAIS